MIAPGPADQVDGARPMAPATSWPSASSSRARLASWPGYGCRITLLSHDANISLPGPTQVEAEGVVRADVQFPGRPVSRLPYGLGARSIRLIAGAVLCCKTGILASGMP